jgi:hypothetical protein
LADACELCVEAASIQIPSGGVWSLTKTLTPESRHETLQFVRQTSIALTDQADELLVELDKFGESLPLPEFVLGQLPDPISEPPQPPAPDLESEWQSPQERDYIMQLCQEAGRDFKSLSDSEKLVLQNSLLSYRTQLQLTKPTLGFTSWDGRQS